MDPADLIEQILVKRGLTTEAEQMVFLHPDYGRLHDPRLLPDMAAATNRLVQARKAGEPVVIYGDYDVDGLSATSLLVDALGKMGLKVSPFIPDRYSEGYGLSDTALAGLVKRGAKLIVTVDTGSTAVKQIGGLKSQGVDVIVTDHHEPPDKLPPALAVINPKRGDSRYPFRELAGTGVAFKLVQALQTELDGLDRGQEKWLLDLVALGTVCDVVPLVDENRVLAAYGLKVLAQTRRPGLRALAEASGVRLDQINATTLGFVLGPRLNAAGRLEHADLSLQLLTSPDLQSARPLAGRLEELNRARQAEQAGIERQAEEMISAMEPAPVIVLAHEDWSHGIVGIVAARLLERHQKPVFAMQLLDDTAKGSARSFGQFDLAQALEQVRPLLISGGGHRAAAGYSLKSADLDSFRIKLNDYWRSLKLADQSGYLAREADLRLKDLAGLDLALIEALDQLAPFGFGNPEPRFGLAGLKVNRARRVGTDNQHLKLELADSRGQRMAAIAFNHPTDYQTGQLIEVVAKLKRNDFNGRVAAELLIEDIT